MTCIAVKIEKKKIEIAGDSQTTWGKNKFPKQDTTDRQVMAAGKIFQVNSMTFGCAGSVAHIGLLQIFAKTNRPKEMERDSVLDWLISFKQFCLDKAKIGFADISVHGIMILDGKVFCFYDFMDVVEVKSFDAVGSGMWLAIGAMELGSNVEKAVSVAVKYDLYCSGEITKIVIPI